MSESPDLAAIQYQMVLLQKEPFEVDPLLKVVLLRTPDIIEIRAVGSVLQTFYNGLESILVLILRSSQGESRNWHQQLLEIALSRP